MTKDELMQLADAYAEAEAHLELMASDGGPVREANHERHEARKALSDAIDTALAKARMDALEEVESLAYSYASSLEWNDDFQEKLRALKEQQMFKLPEPWCASYDTIENRGGALLYYTADQLLEAYNAGLEEAAKVCDEYAADQWSLYKGRAPYKGNEQGRANPDTQGKSDGASNCADAIRALKE